MNRAEQYNDGLFPVPETGDLLDRESKLRALDELFENARTYRSSTEFHNLMIFIGRFHFYAPFNAMLIYIQKPGARFVAPAYRWANLYGRRIRSGANPLVILQPMGPVMFVFDVSDTEPYPDAPPLPRQVTHPFEVRQGHVSSELELTIENARRDGVRVKPRDAGSQSAGEIQSVNSTDNQDVLVKSHPEKTFVSIPVCYEVLLNDKHSREAQYATVAHELAHLYCGHLGTPNEHWWPNRRMANHSIAEFEAESVCFLVCERLGIDNPSEEYLANFIKDNAEIPPISLDCVMRSAGLIEQMGRERLKPRKEKKSE